jgi:hypothetical protein
MGLIYLGMRAWFSLRIQNQGSAGLQSYMRDLLMLLPNLVDLTVRTSSHYFVFVIFVFFFYNQWAVLAFLRVPLFFLECGFIALKFLFLLARKC